MPRDELRCVLINCHVGRWHRLCIHLPHPGKECVNCKMSAGQQVIKAFDQGNILLLRFQCFAGWPEVILLVGNKRRMPLNFSVLFTVFRPKCGRIEPKHISNADHAFRRVQLGFIGNSLANFVCRGRHERQGKRNANGTQYITSS